jgi:hypothetical protein
MQVSEEAKRAFMKNAISFILSDYPRDVDIMDIPTLVEYVDKRILVWEPFSRRSGIELADIIDQLFELNIRTHIELISSGASHEEPKSPDETQPAK